jgi:hypothetical protein
MLLRGKVCKEDGVMYMPTSMNIQEKEKENARPFVSRTRYES